jgi:predicted phosphodiesterase
METRKPEEYREGMTFLQSEIISLIRQGLDDTAEIADLLGCSPDWINKTKRQFSLDIEAPKNYQSKNLRYKVQASLQKARDSLRVERKHFREEIRYHNTTGSLYEEIAQLLREEGRYADFNTYVHADWNGETEGVFQISDIHFNELVELPFNTFDFKIAAQRLQKYVVRARKFFDSHDIKTVHICFTGDMLNSDRRLDEVMNAATNRAKASVLAAMILKQVLIDLNQTYNLKIYMVTGNESRMNKEMGSSEIMQTDNYDFIIHEMLRMMFYQKPGIKFIDGSPIEQPIEVMGHTILLIHGHQIKMSQGSSQIQRLKGKWSDYLQGRTCNYVLFGHFHTARITDLFARSGGVCGANAYSDNQLQLSSRASQNCFLVDKDGIHGIKIDLQHADDFDGYKIDPMLEAYNVTAAARVPWLRKKKI